MLALRSGLVVGETDMKLRMRCEEDGDYSPVFFKQDNHKEVRVPGHSVCSDAAWFLHNHGPITLSTSPRRGYKKMTAAGIIDVFNSHGAWFAVVRMPAFKDVMWVYMRAWFLKKCHYCRHQD